jgi:hypothetical protein
LESELKRKVEEANRKQDQFYEVAEKIKLTENEINFLKDELENERRKSTVDQNKIRKYEQILNSKEDQLRAAQEEFLRRDSDIRNLEKELEE